MDAVFPENLQNLKFGLFISPYMFSARQTYILQPLADLPSEILAENIKFVLKNGDLFEGYFVPAKRCFIGLRSLLRRYRSLNIHFLSFEYQGGGVFDVIAFDSAAVEVEYPSRRVTVERSDLQYDTIPEMHDYRISEVYTMQEHLNSALFRVTARDYSCLKISISIPNQCEEFGRQPVVLGHIDNRITGHWKPRDRVYLEVGSQYWRVYVKKVGDTWYLYRGWTEFASAVSVGGSDLVILFSSFNPFRFDVAVHKSYSSIPKCVETGVGIPKHFMKSVTEEVLENGELIVPALYVEKYGNVFEKDLSIVAPTGSVYNGVFSEEDRKIYGLKDLIADSYIHAGYTLVISQIGSSHLYLSIYDDKLVAVTW